MKSLITLSVLSVAFAACGSSNTSGNGVTADGRCDSGMIDAKALITRDARANDYTQLDKDCQSFSAKYPNSECRAADESGSEIKVKTSEIKRDCAKVHDFLQGTQPTSPVVTQPTAPVVTPVVPVTPVAQSTAECSPALLASLSEVRNDARSMQNAGSDMALVIVAAEKTSNDCKSFLRAYPDTVCKAQDEKGQIVVFNSSDIKNSCKQISDIVEALHNNKPNPLSEGLDSEIQSIE